MSLQDIIEQMERKAFAEWHERTHGKDAVVDPLSWAAWQGRAALVKVCRGVRHPGCEYLAVCGSICDKCGQSV